MFCTKCGNKAADNARFCSKCGNMLEQSAPVGHQPNAKVKKPSSKAPLVIGICTAVALIAISAVAVIGKIGFGEKKPNAAAPVEMDIADRQDIKEKEFEDGETGEAQAALDESDSSAGSDQTVKYNKVKTITRTAAQESIIRTYDECGYLIDLSHKKDGTYTSTDEYGCEYINGNLSKYIAYVNNSNKQKTALEIRCGWDSKGRMVSMTYIGIKSIDKKEYLMGRVVWSYFDEGFLRDAALYNAEDKLVRQVEFIYDDLWRCTSIYNVMTRIPTVTAEDTYDEDGSLLIRAGGLYPEAELSHMQAAVSLVFPEKALVEETTTSVRPGYIANYEYDDTGRIIAVTSMEETTIRVWPGCWIEKNEYDSAGRIIAKAEESGLNQYYEYNELGQVSKIRTIETAYDELEYNRERLEAYEYTDFGKLKQRLWSEETPVLSNEDSDSIGAFLDETAASLGIQKGGTDYIYDEQNRIIEIKDWVIRPEDGERAYSEIIEYEYY